MEGLWICVPSIRVLTVQNFQKVLFLFISLNIQTCIAQPLQVQIPASGTQSKL